MASRPTAGIGTGPVAIGLLVATGLSTLLPWAGGNGDSVLGVRFDDAFLVIAASFIGVVLQRMGAKPAWIAPGFAAVVQFRDIRELMDSDVSVGVGLWIGLVTSVAAMAVLIAELLIEIRAQRPAEGQAGP